MASTMTMGIQVATGRPCISSTKSLFGPNIKELVSGCKIPMRNISSVGPLCHRIASTFVKHDKFVTRAIATEAEPILAPALSIDLRGLHNSLVMKVFQFYLFFCNLNGSQITTGKKAFIAGVADNNGYGWAIAKSLAAAGAEILLGTWVPVSF